MEELFSQMVGYLRGMWRFRWWGLAFAWIAGIAGGFAVYSMPDRYESTARIYVDTQSVLRPLMSGLAVQPNTNQQIAILSRTLITRPNVEKLITMADLDLAARTPGEREALIAELTGGLQILGAGRDNLFTLAYQDVHPERAQRIVQALVSLFVESGLVGKRQDSTSARRFIDEQIASYEQKLTEAENRLKDFRLRNMALLGDGGRDYVSQMTELSAQLRQAELELKEAENSRDSLKRQLAGEDPVLLEPPANSSPVSLPEIDGRIDLLKKNLDGLLLRYTDEHPDVVGARRVIAQLEEQKQKEVEAMKKADAGAPWAPTANPVVQQMKISLAEAEARVASLAARVAEFGSRLAQLRSSAELLPKIEAEQTQLNRDYEVHKRNYESLVTRRESANMSVEMTAQGGITEFRVIDPPSLPNKPAAPNRALLMPLAGLVGLVAGIALTFLLSQLRPAFGDVRSLREITGLPVLGAVSLLADPVFERRRRRGLLAFGGGVTGFVMAVAGMTAMVQLLQG
ncbi:XrtA system polysaccharide chain length determinant [Aromatoleum anaerobium]|uniref:Chain length-determining protein n=1 Tax=Aromatoleum anaerobium TaxID=182180 RepID=A0ABX1PFF2_9RHOO|nr:XrtA system polysaccharide chain length determinant [Aromatoleum anaerobium]MCK0509232.1 Wzz/FepE/Etk N-terminal domain-containing protein [Aromatoleum anaerobium]